MEHFKNKKDAQKYFDSYKGFQHSVSIFKKRKEHRDSNVTPFVVGTDKEWINL